MNTVLQAHLLPPEAAAVAAAAAPRFDLYAGIHRALRLLMADTLSRLGSLDAADAEAVAAMRERVATLVALVDGHLAHEESFVHPLLEAAEPGATRGLAADHVQHREAMDALRDGVAALRAAPSPAGVQRLYRQLALFVAENLEHMHEEETVHNARLWAAYGDAELLAVHHRVVASVGPDEMQALLPWMLRAQPPAELALLVGGLQGVMPPEAVRGVIEAAHSVLDQGAWAKLARALGLPPVPGLVTV